MAGKQIQGRGGRRERLLTPHDLAGIVTAQQGFVTGPIDYNSLINKPVIPSHLTDLDTTVSGTQLNSLKTKVDGIQAGAQVNVQSDWNAVSGDALILNKPTIPAAQVNSDWNAVSGVAQILNKPALATVATSGSYNDLSSKPTALPPNGPAGGSLTGTYPNPGVIVPVSSVFGRTGAVVAASGDYNTGQVTEGTNLYFTAARVLATVLAGLSTATNAAITAADSVLVALGKLQAQISANVTALAGKLTAANNLSDVANAATARGNLGVIIPQGYIDGLQMVWNSATSVSVTSGTAYIPSLGNVLVSNSTLTLSGLSLTASTWYHVYLYSNAGVPAIECVTTAPVLYYGTAYQKTGDNTRRYIGSVRSGPSSNIYDFVHMADGFVRYLEATMTNGTEFQVANGISYTIPTTISCSNVVPVTGSNAQLHSDNNSQQQMAFSNSMCNFTLSGNAALHLSSALPAGFTERLIFTLPLDASQTFEFMYVSAPSSNASIRVFGYWYQR